MTIYDKPIRNGLEQPNTEYLRELRELYGEPDYEPTDDTYDPAAIMEREAAQAADLILSQEIEESDEDCCCAAEGLALMDRDVHGESPISQVAPMRLTIRQAS